MRMMPKIVCYVRWRKIERRVFYMLTEPLWLRLVESVAVSPNWGSLAPLIANGRFRQPEPAIRTGVLSPHTSLGRFGVRRREWVERTIRGDRSIG